jgi:hypothetical protein
MEALGSAVGGGVRASESERVRSRKRGLVLAVGGIFFQRQRERKRVGRRCARGDRHYFMEFWLGLSTNLVRCSEDDGRRKEKRGAYEIGGWGEREGAREKTSRQETMVYFVGIGGERSRRIKGALRDRGVRTDEDKAGGKLVGTHLALLMSRKAE